jgi:glycoprotein endo-alpha-1,2-mannosidase
VSFHIEPYPERSEQSVREDLIHIIQRFGKHKAFYTLSAEDPRPVVYIYDSYQTSPSSWANIFSVNGQASIRKTRFDVVALGLWVEEHHGSDLVRLFTTLLLINFSFHSAVVGASDID